MGELSLSERDFNTLLRSLDTLPPEVEMIFIANHSSVLMSTIPELKNYKTIDDKTLFEFIRNSSNEYFYQMVTPPLESENEILMVSRVLRQRDPGHPPKKGEFKMHDIRHEARYVFITISAAVIFCIIMIIHLSRTISRSISVLEHNTQKIADGELDVELERPKNIRASNEITRLSENLDRMRIALKDENERRARFIMGISHDLRTPVAVIKGYTEAISDGMISSETELKKALEIIEIKSSQLETMINTLISFVKLKSTDWRDQLKKQPLKPFLVEFADSAVMNGTIFKRTVKTNIDISDNISVRYDKQLFYRALENLLSNAIRYTEKEADITISAKEDASRIFVSISDNGIGMKKEDLKHIFELFYRASNSRREEGMGIGLSVVKEIIDTHGWNIDVQSELHHGATFSVIIPKAQG